MWRFVDLREADARLTVAGPYRLPDDHADRASLTEPWRDRLRLL
jgi:hypothetical protein